jgi:uncharacterized protein (DUF1330 family)
MTVQLIIMGTRRPDSDDDYAAYGSVAVPIMVAAGGTFTGQYGRIDDLVGDDGPQVVGIMEFADEAAVRAAFKSPEYEAVVPHRDKAFERFNVILAAAPPAA